MFWPGPQQDLSLEHPSAGCVRVKLTAESSSNSGGAGGKDRPVERTISNNIFSLH